MSALKAHHLCNGGIVSSTQPYASFCLAFSWLFSDNRLVKWREMAFPLTHCLLFKFMYLEVQVSFLRRCDYTKPNLNEDRDFSREDPSLRIAMAMVITSIFHLISEY